MKDGDIEALRVKLTELELVKQQQAGQIETLKHNNEQLHEKSGQASNTIRHLTDELNKVKVTLDDVTRRHRQVTFHLDLT